MITVQEAIVRFRRDAMLGLILKIVLAGGLVSIFALNLLPRKAVEPNLLLLGLAVVWFTLWFRTLKGSRLAAQSSSLIAAGNLEQAEVQIAENIRSFSLSRSVKSMSLLNLASVRLAQKRWPDSALLCREVLSSPGKTPEHLSKSSRLMLADSLLEMGDLRGSHEALIGLYRFRLTLSEALNLLRVQSDYLARIGAWQQLVEGIATKVELAELMTAATSARVQALLALGAKKTGLGEWANWLRRRVELLSDVRELAAERPILWELWQA